MIVLRSTIKDNLTVQLSVIRKYRTTEGDRFNAVKQLFGNSEQFKSYLKDLMP